MAKPQPAFAIGGGARKPPSTSAFAAGGGNGKPPSASYSIGLLIQQAERNLQAFRADGRDIEAAGCSIRITALKDALRMAKIAEGKK